MKKSFVPISRVLSVFLLMGSIAPALALTPKGLATPDDVRQAIIDAQGRVQEQDIEGADRLLTSAISSLSFEQLEANERHATLVFAGYVALESGHAQRAHVLFTRSSAMKQADGDDWLGRMHAASQSNQDADAVQSLVRVATRFPKSLPEVDQHLVFDLARRADSLPDQGAARWALLQALFDAKWKSHGNNEPSEYWVELALHLLEQKQEKRAIEVARRVTAPTSIVALRADKRFEPVSRALKDKLDVARAASAEVAKHGARSKAEPRSLEAVMMHASALLEARRPEEALAITDVALANAARRSDPLAYDDADEYLVWIMDYRARALKRLGRWREAEEQQLLASRRLEDGSANVSQSINLGDMYCDLDRPDDALRAVAAVKENVSSYGQMQIAAVQLAASSLKQDAAAVESNLSYMSEHRDDALGTYQLSLVLAGKMDGAAELMIARLADPKLRSDALVEIQDYARVPGTPRTVAWHESWKQLIAREDIQAAVAKVGSIERYEIEPL